MLPIRKIASVLALFSSGSWVGSRAWAQACANNEIEATIIYKSEYLPIEMSGFFPYLPAGPNATDGGAAKKYTSMTWEGAGAWINPACTCFTSSINATWSGAWVFSTTNFSSTDTRRVDYLRSAGCGGGEYVPGSGVFIPGPTATTPTVETSNYPGPPTYSSCINGNIYYDTLAKATLSDEFTLELAKTRAENFKTAGSSKLQFWNNNSPASAGEAANLMAAGSLSRTSPITAHAERVKFSAVFGATGANSCAGAGKFQITYYYKRWTTGQPEPAGFTTTTEQREFKDAPYVIDFRDYHFELKQGEQCKLVKVTARSMEECKLRQPGDPFGANKSVDMFFALGNRPDDSTAGALGITASAVSSSLYSPAALQLLAVDNVNTIVVRQGEVLRQIKASQTFADIVTLSAHAYEIRFYSPSQVGATDGNGIYAVSGQPYVSYLVENPDAGGATNRLRFIETRGSVQKTTLYDYDAATGTMEMTSGNGARIDRLQKTVNGATTIETRTIKDSTSQAVSITRETKVDFGFGPVVTERVLDPSGAAVTTSYTYYTNAVSDGASYGRLKQTIEPSGRWTRYTYDSTGRNAETVTQFLNAAVGSAANLNRQTLATYGTIADLDGDTTPETLNTTVESLLGQEIGRSFVLIYSQPQVFHGQTVEVRASIRAIAPGATWDAPGNLVTLTRTVQSGALAFKPMSTLAPDQTLALYEYAEGPTSLITTLWQGQPNAAKDAVISGTKTVTTEDLFGRLISSTVSDIATNLVLTAQTVSTTDTFGRPTRIDYADGTYETRSYACCGLDNVRDRTGMTTIYTYDALGHVTATTRAGLTSLHTLDPDGRVLVVSRKGSDNSIITQQTNTYNLAGRLTSTKDALNRTTTFTEVINGSGNTVKTTTAPDGGTRIATYAKDGSLLSVAGTAGQPLNYQYGIEVDGVFTQEIRVGSAGEATEWVKNYADFAGRPYKTVFPDGAVQRNYYNALGQLERSVDPDGVTTLVAYNARGEQVVAALDVDRNGTIDRAGTDRLTRTLSEVALRGAVTVQRTTTELWETDTQDVPTTVSITEQSVDGLLSWQTVRGLTTTSVTTLDGSGGRTVTTTSPDGVKTVQVFANDRLQSTTTMTAANAQLTATTYSYDPHGRIQATTDARTGATSFTYFVDDQIQSVTTPDPDPGRSGDGYDAQTTTYAYDNAGRQNQVTQPDGGIVNTTYWPTGAVKRTWGSRTYPVEYAYDSQGRIKTLTTWQNFAGSSGQAVTTWNYHPTRGWLDNKRYANNTGPAYTYKLSGRLLTRTWARGISTTYDYNDAGDLSGLNYSDSTPDVTFGYDRLGRPKTRTDASGTCVWTYDTSGQLQDELYTAGLLNGQSVERDFDALHRFSALTGTSIPLTSYAYDAASRLQTVTQGANTATYGYLANSPLVQSVTFAQGGAPRLTTTKSYDALNRLTAIVNTPSASTPISHTYNYNTANQRTQAVREDNTSWNYGYDALGQVTSGQKRLADNTPLLGHDSAWTYDDIGNRKTGVTNGRTSTYAPNTLNQYTQRTVPGTIDVFGSAAADATVTVNGQTTQRQGEAWYTSFTDANTVNDLWADFTITGIRAGGGPGGTNAVSANTRNQFLPKTPEAYSYDADGNLTGDGRWTYFWDGENRLSACETRIEILPPLGRFPLAQRRRLEFAYDAQGRRVSKKVSNWAGNGWTVASSTLFVYDGWNMVAELNALNGNAAIRTYVWGTDLSGSYQGAGGVGGLLSIMHVVGLSSARTHFAAYDASGNISALIAAIDGAPSAAYDYTVFGETIASDGPTARLNPFRFSTKYTDDETNLVYYGLRYYQPETGRWPSRDPIEETGGTAIYGFVGNDPVSIVDVLGLEGSNCKAFSIQVGIPEWKASRIINPLVRIRGGASGTLNLSGTRCEACCSDGRLRYTYKLGTKGSRLEVSVGVILGLSWEQSITNTPWGDGTLKAQAGGSIDVKGGVVLAGTVEYDQCTGDTSASFSGNSSLTLTGSIGAYGTVDFKSGKSVGLELSAGISGTGNFGLEIKCAGDRCKIRQGFSASAEVFGKVQYGWVSAKYSFWQGSWDGGMKDVGDFANPFIAALR